MAESQGKGRGASAKSAGLCSAPCSDIPAPATVTQHLPGQAAGRSLVQAYQNCPFPRQKLRASNVLVGPRSGGRAQLCIWGWISALGFLPPAKQSQPSALAAMMLSFQSR